MVRKIIILVSGHPYISNIKLHMRRLDAHFNFIQVTVASPFTASSFGRSEVLEMSIKYDKPIAYTRVLGKGTSIPQPDDAEATRRPRPVRIPAYTHLLLELG